MSDVALWWRERTLREQRLLLVMFALIALALGWLLVIRPLSDALDAAQTRHAEAVTALIDELMDTHPCRAILVLFDERVGEPRARLASHIRRAGDAEGGRYWEEIRLAGPARATHQVMSSVAALAKSDRIGYVRRASSIWSTTAPAL